jgi:chromosome segregation protein
MKELDLCRQKLSESEERSAGIRERRGLEQKRVEKLKEDLFGLLQASSQATNKKESLKRRHAEIRAQAARHGAEKEGREKELSELRNRADNLALQEERLNERRNSNQDMVSTLESEKSRITGRLGELNRSLKSLENQLGAQRGKLSSLEELRDSFSAYGEGAKSLLKEDSEWSSKTILAVAGELVDVDEEFQPALVAALAEKVDYLVVESLAEALEGVERLETRSAGRAAFIPRDAIHQESGGPEARNHELTPLIDLVSAREGFEDVVDHLLKKTVLVQDLKAAARSYSESEGAFDYVTRDGRSLSRWGIVAGGAQTTGAGEIFRIKNEIRALYSEISLNESSSARLQDELNDMDLELAEKNGQLESIRTTLGEIKVEEARLRKDMETIQEQIKNCGLSVDALEKEIQGLDSELERVEKEQITLEEQISRLSLRRSEMEAEKAQAQESLAQCDSQLDQISARTGDDRIKVAQLDERAKSLSREIHAAQSSKEQIAGQLESMKSRIKGDDEEAERLRAELGVSSEKEKSLMERHSNIRARVEELKELTGKLSEKIKSLENETKQRGKDLGALKDQAHALETRAVRHEQSLTDIVEKIVERHGVDPRRVAPETPPATPEEIASLKERIESMGQVNLAAIDESRQTEERLNFLMEQEGDLQAAVDSLYTTINRINRTTRDRFQEAFDLINSKFQEIFPFLFRGGEARLELTDAEDLLETGVDILARPPGKRIQNMSLLSGGEKALTAVALIFSIFLIRPSPFCLLDEVDAPLDDANLSMFNEMLRRLSDATQFILITHNKASMERADSLYGVTMAQAGVSNLVSVEFMDKEAV